MTYSPTPGRPPRAGPARYRRSGSGIAEGCDPAPPVQALEDGSPGTDVDRGWEVSATSEQLASRMRRSGPGRSREVLGTPPPSGCGSATGQGGVGTQPPGGGRTAQAGQNAIRSRQIVGFELVSLGPPGWHRLRRRTSWRRLTTGPSLAFTRA